MKSKALLFIVIIVFLGLALLSLRTPKETPKDEIRISINSSIDPVEAFGVLTFPNGKTSKIVATALKDDEKLMISLPLPVNIPQRELASALLSATVISSAGEVISSEVRRVEALRAHKSPLPVCEEKPVNVIEYSEKYGTMESLYRTKLKKRSLYKNKIDSMMTGIFLKRLQAAETKLGFSNDKPLSSNLSLSELNDRLGRVKQAIINLAYYNSRGKPAKEEK